MPVITNSIHFKIEGENEAFLFDCSFFIVAIVSINMRDVLNFSLLTSKH